MANSSLCRFVITLSIANIIPDYLVRFNATTVDNRIKARKDCLEQAPDEDGFPENARATSQHGLPIRIGSDEERGEEKIPAGGFFLFFRKLSRQ